MPCEPAPPCEPNFPLFCDPLPSTIDGQRLVVEDSASCQKTLVKTSNPALLYQNLAGTIQFSEGSDTDLIKLPNMAEHQATDAPKIIVLLADGTMKAWEPSTSTDNFLAYWDGAAWVSPAGAQPLPDHYASAAFGDSTVAVSLVANVPTLMTNATSNLFSADTVLRGFTYTGDSIICNVAGTYMLNGLITVRMNQVTGQVIAVNSYLNSSPIGRVWSRSVIPGFIATSIPMPSYIVDLSVNDVIRVFVTSIAAGTEVEYINGIITITQLR
jgi:hypothetical protein